ncbi:MAG: peptidoglycan-binding protein [Eubacteriales bacterium]|nr:peptidoglycan-binding protein [Eubacteriales bacterium]
MASIYTELRKGAAGNDVKALQNALSKQGYQAGSSGVYDDQTLAAVKRYQQKTGQTVSGNADDATLRSLYGTPSAKYEGGYIPGAHVNSAEQYLKMLQSQKPGDYSGKYTRQAEALLGQIINRKPFSYDANSDPLYQIYRDRYIMGGQRAMENAMGQAAQLTGGYGNTYAQTVGQQQYQQYMEGLNDKVPELAQQAYTRYQGEGDRLRQSYQLLQSADDAAYGRWADGYNRWNNETQQAQSAYESAYDRDYSRYNDQRNYDQQQSHSARQYAYQTAMSVIQTGNVPTDELLRAAGISRADAELMAAYHKPKSSGGGSRSSQQQQQTPAPTAPQQSAEEIAKNGSSAMASWMTEYEYNSRKAAAKRMGYTKSELLKTDSYEDYISQKVSSALDAGQITAAEGLYIIDKAAEKQNTRRSGTRRGR